MAKLNSKKWNIWHLQRKKVWQDCLLTGLFKRTPDKFSRLGRKETSCNWDCFCTSRGSRTCPRPKRGQRGGCWCTRRTRSTCSRRLLLLTDSRPQTKQEKNDIYSFFYNYLYFIFIVFFIIIYILYLQFFIISNHTTSFAIPRRVQTCSQKIVLKNLTFKVMHFLMQENKKEKKLFFFLSKRNFFRSPLIMYNIMVIIMFRDLHLQRRSMFFSSFKR